MLNEKDTYNEHRESLSNFIDEDEGIAETDEIVDGYDYEFDNSMNDVDFSNVSGNNFKRSFANAKKQMGTRISGVIVPEERNVIVEGQSKEEDEEFFMPRKVVRKPMSGATKISGVIVPEERNLIVEGQSEEEEVIRPRRVVRKPIAPPPQRKKRKVVARESAVRKPRRPNRPPPRRKKTDTDIAVEQGRYNLKGKNKRKISDVIVPSNRKVIVKGVSDFIVSQDNDLIKNIGYYKGKKLKQLVLTYNNNSAVDFEMEVFNPSMPLDYLYSTAQNLNDKVQVAGGPVSYTDVLFNLLANPTFIPNAQFVFAGPSVTQQKSQPLHIVNQNIAGAQKIVPINLDLQIDTMQVASDIVYFDMNSVLNRPYIPDGMDIIRYKVLAGNTVTMAFFYMQVNLKKIFYKQANKKGIL